MEEMVCVHGQQGPWFARSFLADVIFFFLSSASFVGKFWDGVATTMSRLSEMYRKIPL